MSFDYPAPVLQTPPSSGAPPFSAEPDLQIQRWTLRFTDPALDQAFADHQFAISHRKLQVGLAAIAGITVYLVIANATTIHDPTVAIPNLVLLAVVTPIFGLSFHSSFRRLAGPAVSILVLAQAGALTLTQFGYYSLTRDVARYDSVVTLLQLLLGAVWVFTLSGIGFRRSYVTVGIGIGAWSAVALVTSRHGLGRFSAMVIGVLLATLAGYFMELYQRRDFVRGRLLRAEMEKSDRLLLNVLPEAIANRLKSGEQPIADIYPEATILFTDIVGFTDRSAGESPGDTVAMLNECLGAFDEIARELQLQPIKTAGDAYMVAGGVPVPRSDHAEAVARMAVDMHRAVTAINARKGWNLSLRIGLHSGPVAAAVIGTRKFSYDIWRNTVNVASRMGVVGARRSHPGHLKRLRAPQGPLPVHRTRSDRSEGKGRHGDLLWSIRCHHGQPIRVGRCFAPLHRPDAPRARNAIRLGCELL